MEAYSDGVFSIASTLLVLEIALHPPGTALEQLRHAWPAYLGYLISFLTIGASWLEHGAITDRLTRVDGVLLRINLLLLLVIGFLPFPTKLIAEAINQRNEERVSSPCTASLLLAIRLLGSALDMYARRERLYADEEADEELRTDRRTFLPAVISYVVAILIGLVFPTVAVVLYLVLATILIVPFREIGNLFSRR